MIQLKECLYSVEPIWIISLSGLAWLMWQCCFSGRVRWRVTLQQILRDEHGGAYSFTYVVCAPIYMLLLCLIIDSSLLVLVKMGSMYSAYCAARSATVWANASPQVASDKVRLAAVHALVPFGSSNRNHTQGTGGGGSGAGEYVAAYRRYTRGGPATSQYLVAKYGYVERATQVNYQPTHPGENDDVTATVTYEAPIHVPGVGRILGHVCPWGGPFYTYTIRSKVTLPNEGAKGADQQPSGHPMGIDYASF
jgi:hypothetical protein